MDKDIERLIEKLNDEQLKVVEKIGYENIDIVDLEEKLSNYLQLHCLTNEDGLFTKEGNEVLSILEIIGEL